jgi:putative SOS response-associated peptidase YedK
MLHSVCGRYAATRDVHALAEVFEASVLPAQGLPADYNVAPTKDVHAVIERATSREGHEGSDREIAVVRWGLVPSWAKEPSIGSRLINARVETVMDKPAFRKAFATRRTLLPADGYYEWEQPVETNGPKRPKQPWFIHPEDGGVLAMAGIYEFWRDPTRPEDDPHAWLMTAAVITTSALDDLGRIHDRMPLVVPQDQWSLWLDPNERGGQELLAGLIPASARGLTAFPVSTRVNSVRNNGPELLERVALSAGSGSETAKESGSDPDTLF